MEINNSNATPVSTTALQDKSAPAPTKVKHTATAGNTEETQFSNADLDKAIEKANKILADRNTQLEFSIDQDSGKTVVKLIDKQTNDVLRQYPSKEMLSISKEIDRFQGALISEKV